MALWCFGGAEKLVLCICPVKCAEAVGGEHKSLPGRRDTWTRACRTRSSPEMKKWKRVGTVQPHCGFVAGRSKLWSLDRVVTEVLEN